MEHDEYSFQMLIIFVFCMGKSAYGGMVARALNTNQRQFLHDCGAVN